MPLVALMSFSSAAHVRANGSTAEQVSVNSAGTGSSNGNSGQTTGTPDDAPVISANGTARSDSDYTLTSGTLTIPAGETTATFSVPVKGDLLDEANETFLVNLSSPVNAAIFDGRGAGTITDNDATPRIAINNVTVTEGNTGAVNASFTVSLSAVSGRVVTVQFATADGTATAPSDYTAKSGTLMFSPGQTTKPVVIQVKGDTIREPNETLKVNLSAPTNAAFSNSQGIGTIINND